MVSDEIEDMLTAVKAQTNEMFVHYAAADKTAFDDMEQDTMNLTEWHQIVRECSACKFPPEQPKARKIIGFPNCCLLTRRFAGRSAGWHYDGEDCDQDIRPSEFR